MWSKVFDLNKKHVFYLQISSANPFSIYHIKGFFNQTVIIRANSESPEIQILGPIKGFFYYKYIQISGE